MNRTIRNVCVILIVMLSVLSTLASVFLINRSYLDTAHLYTRSGAVIHLNDVPEDKAGTVTETLLDTVSKHHALVVRGDLLLSPIDGSFAGYKLGFFGTADAGSGEAELSFLGTPILSVTSLQRLLSSNPDKTLGLDQVEANQLAPLPSIRGGSRLVAVHLPTLITTSATVSGTYRVIGLDANDYQTLVKTLAAELGRNPDDLQRTRMGFAVDEGLVILLLTGALVATWLTLTFVLILGTYQALPHLGTHLLLGWSRFAYTWKLHRLFIITALLTLLLPLPIALLMFQGFSITKAFVLTALLSVTPALALTFVALLLASLVIALVKPIQAIRNRISSKVMVAALIVVYLIASVGFVVTLQTVDEPLRQTIALRQVAARWQRYSDLEILHKRNMLPGMSSMRRFEEVISKKTFAWYRSFEGTPGAYIAHMSHYDERVLDTWRGLDRDRHVPIAPFWLFVASPNYLIDQGLSLDPTWVHEAKDGVRVVLLPSTMSAKERRAMTAYMTDEGEKTPPSALETTFTKTKTMRFYDYTPKVDWFTWSTDLKTPTTVNAPVIVVATTANMIPFESESLSACGLSDGYLKIKTDTLTRVTTPSYLASQNLPAQALEFLPVSNAIAGLQAETRSIVGVLFGALTLLTILSLIMITSLIKLFVLSQRQVIAVKRLLGHPLLGLFAKPIMLVVIVMGLGLALCLALSCHITWPAVLVLALLQIALLLHQARASARAELAALIKSS